jgi:hypothetical protein
MFALGQNFPGEKGSVRRCVVVMQRPIRLPPKFGKQSSHIFMQSTYNATVLRGIDRFACKDEFFVNNPLDVKKKNCGHALDFGLHLSRLFQSR